MARISVWFVRASLLHFAVGASAGAWQLAARADVLPVAGWSLRTMHVEGMLLGWLVQFALGVALWILPFSRSVSEDRRFWFAWGLLNGGILLVALGTDGLVPPLRVLGRASELGAGGLLVWGLWPRLRALPHRNH